MSKEIRNFGSICLATVTTDSFVPGTLVTLNSFLKHNSWFKGDIVIIHDELNPEYREYLGNIYERIRFLQVALPLQQRIDEIIEVFSEFAAKRARFYSLEIFRLNDYDKVLFCDSDLLFRQSVEDLFDLPQNLIACGDGAHYKGLARLSGGEIVNEPVAAQKGEKIIYNTFNSGFFLVDHTFLTDQHYTGLLNLTDSGIYKNSNLKLADQAILNTYFTGKQHLVGAAYNYLLAHRAAIYEREGISFTEARVLHFNGPYKPWTAHDILHRGLRDPVFIKACSFWFESYAECLQQLYMRNRSQILK